MKTFVSLFLLALFNSPSFAIDYTMPSNEEEKWDKIDKLGWIDGPTVVKHISQGTYKLSENQSALIGEDAKQALYWNNGLEFSSDFYVIDNNDFSSYNFNYFDEGYVKLDDWKNVNADEFLKNKKDAAKENNKDRIKNGFETITNIEWYQEPILDKANNSVYYALKITWENHITINAKVLLLGRNGHTEVAFVTGPLEFEATGKAQLASIVTDYQFNKEKEYSKFTTGDKVAATGIGGLLAASLGIKALKGGALAAVLIFAKKLWFLIFIPFVFAWNWIKRLFTRKE